VTEYEDFELDDILEPAVKSCDGSSLFRRFKPSFPKSHPTLEIASKLNCAFVLCKGSRGDVGGAESREHQLAKQGREQEGVSGKVEGGRADPPGRGSVKRGREEEGRSAEVEGGRSDPSGQGSSKWEGGEVAPSGQGAVDQANEVDEFDRSPGEEAAGAGQEGPVVEDPVEAAAAREQQSLQCLSSRYARPQYKRSSKFKRAR
jgi:hypothetical protein